MFQVMREKKISRNHKPSMPKTYTRRTRRPARRPKRVVRRRRARTGGRQGGFLLKRKCAVFGVNRGAVAGLITSGNTNLLNFGTPVACVNSISNFYDVPFSFQFKLDQLQGYADIPNIADKYKIMRCTVGWRTGNNAGIAGSNLPWMEYVIDHDDSSTPSIANIREKMGVRSKGFSQQGALTMSVAPRVADAIYGTGLTTSYAIPSKAMYINSAYTDTAHFGIKGVLRSVYLDGSNNSTAFTVDVGMTVHCKDLQ